MESENKKYKMVTMSMDIELYAKVKELSVAQRRTITATVETIVQEYFERNPTETKPAARKARTKK